MWSRRPPDDETLITRRHLGQSRSDMSYDVAGLGLGGEKKGKRKMYLYVGVAVAVIVIVIVGVWWDYFRTCPGPGHPILRRSIRSRRHSARARARPTLECAG